MMPSLVILHPLQLPAGALPGAIDYSKAEYINTQQDLPVGDNYFTNSRHERLLATGFFLLKSNKEYVLTFEILAQVLVVYSFLN
jgi:hypothetical protein